MSILKHINFKNTMNLSNKTTWCKWEERKVLSVLFTEIKKKKGEVLVKRKSSGETKNEGETRMKQLEVKKGGNGYKEEGSDGYSSNQRCFWGCIDGRVYMLFSGSLVCFCNLKSRYKGPNIICEKRKRVRRICHVWPWRKCKKQGIGYS